MRLVEGKDGRPLRADAQRNRARVLDVAIEMFASDGLSVSVHEIARRAGVGTGTVSRHFPTKEALFEAVVLARVEWLVRRAHDLAATKVPGDAFFEFLTFMVEEGSTNRGLADALAGAGFDVEAAASGSPYDFGAAMHDLLVSAQRAGVVRKDLDTADVKAVIEGCLARERGAVDAAARERMLAIASQGLRA
jgi:AcrR family transcriptional regulator